MILINIIEQTMCSVKYLHSAGRRENVIFSANWKSQFLFLFFTDFPNAFLNQFAEKLIDNLKYEITTTFNAGKMFDISK